MLRSSNSILISLVYTANVFPTKSIGEPRVTRGTPQQAHNYYRHYMLPEIPIGSHSGTQVDIA